MNVEGKEIVEKSRIGIMLQYHKIYFNIMHLKKGEFNELSNAQKLSLQTALSKFKYKCIQSPKGVPIMLFAMNVVNTFHSQEKFSSMTWQSSKNEVLDGYAENEAFIYWKELCYMIPKLFTLEMLQNMSVQRVKLTEKRQKSTTLR